MAIWPNRNQAREAKLDRDARPARQSTRSAANITPELTMILAAEPPSVRQSMRCTKR